MTNQEILSIFIPLVEFIGTAMGPSTEVVLNDLSSPTRAVIAIHNGHLSGRSIGSPTTDFALDVLHSHKYETSSYAANYKSTANGKRFVSSSYFINNPSGKLIGMLCINTDETSAQEFFLAAKRLLSSTPFATMIDEKAAESHFEENLNTPIASLASSVISKTCEKYGVSPERMTRKEKMEIVQELSEQGVAEVKGSVSEIARQLDLSESTVYRYIAMKNK